MANKSAARKVTSEPEQAPDMAQLQRAGVSLKDAIAQCEAWAAAHPEPQPQPEPEPQPDALPWAEPDEPILNLAMYMPPLPGPIIKQHEPPNDLDRILCLSLLHTIVEMISGAYRIDPTRLAMEGLSPSAAEEICGFIRRGNTI
jgi:hypothetical protein